ncbi:MAG: response regulator [Candidatus Omnitrophica bacterium]|nr:response regulator [Candidatus Omnitrophota bacterium]
MLFGQKKESKGIRILIADDNEVDRTLIEKTLEKEGYAVIKAENGQQAMDLAQSQKPDVIVLDCEMPVMGGVEALQHLRTNLETKDIPVIFLTSVDTPRNIVDCFDLEAANYLSKPLTPKFLLSEIAMILEEKEEE